MGKRRVELLALKPVALEMLCSGMAAKAVARELGCGKMTVWRWANSAGLVLRRGGRGGLDSLDQVARARAVELFGQGFSVGEVALRVGYSEQWVRGVRRSVECMDTALVRGRRGGARRLASVDCVGSGRVGRGRRLTHSERVAIALGLGEGKSAREIARGLARDPSTISREIARSSTQGRYDAWQAESRAFEQRARPKTSKLDTNPALRRQVVALLDRRFSPQQVAIRLRYQYPCCKEMHVAAETIYQALYLQGQGALRQELKRDKALRSGRTSRIPRSRLAGLPGRGRRTWVEGAEISTRPPIAADRAIPGHWEGDLIIGGDGASALITLVERSSRFVLIHRLGTRHDSTTVAQALTSMVTTLPGQFTTITWDQGVEMAKVKTFEVASDVKVYFADPHSPWQRGTNERFNRDIREYFPKGTNFTHVTDQEVEQAQNELNDRARVVLHGMTPREKLAQQLNDAMTA